MKALVLGGSRYFGRHLIDELLHSNYQVFVATRGNLDFPQKNKVHFIEANREVQTDLDKLATLGPFDIIFDQICMSGRSANMAVEAFKNSCKRYVFTSTGSVYEAQIGVELNEEKFDFKNYPLNLTDTNPYNYQEAKRQAEVVFGNQKYFEAVMVRFPIVLGLDDYTERLKFHVEKVKKGEDIYFPNLDMKMTFVDSKEAGQFLKFIGESSFQGAINCASTGSIAMKDIMKLIEEKAHKKAVLVNTENEKNHSPFGFNEDFVLPNSKGSKLGFHFMELKDYLPKLIEGYL